MGIKARGRRSDDRRQMTEGGGQTTGEASRHLPSASLGHYATLSIIVRGKGRCEIVDFIVF